jgi:NTE family protein
MPEVWDRMIELQFTNKTSKDVELARFINALLTVVMELQGLKPGDPNPALAHAGLEQLNKYKVFENIIPDSNSGDEDAAGSSDFSPSSIQRRIETGYADAKRTMKTLPPSASELRSAVAMGA